MAMLEAEISYPNLSARSVSDKNFFKVRNITSGAALPAGSENSNAKEQVKLSSIIVWSFKTIL